MRKLVVGFVVACVATLCSTLPSCGTPPEPAGATAADSQSPRDDSPKPEDVVRRMADYLGNLPACQCSIEATIHIQAKDIDNRTVANISARLRQPNRLAVHVDENGSGVKIVSDGEQLVLYMLASKRYVVRDAPADFKDFPDAVKKMGITLMGNFLPAGGDDFYNNIMAGVTKSEYLGTEKVGDALCHRCRFHRDNLNWQIWIETGERPLVHQVVTDLSEQLKGDPDLEDGKLEYTAVFSDWNVEPTFADADFAFDPPEDAEKVDTLVRKRETPHALLGKAAPAFRTADPEDQPIDLGEHLGKSVIMLDFWATWCGPCIAAMPELEKVGKQFADQGLVFYSVNVREDAATAKEFLASNKLDLTVAMDPEGKISRAYNVEGIPQTVLIGKDGTVQVVHVGFNPALGQALTTQVEALLAGKELAGKVDEPADEPPADEAETSDATNADESAADDASDTTE